jgi:hypothetical protein
VAYNQLHRLNLVQALKDVIGLQSFLYAESAGRIFVKAQIL